MTFFSRMYLNPQTRGGRKFLTNPQAMHAAIMASFPPPDSGPVDTGRVLWRIDSAHPRHVLYVVSPELPDFTHIREQGAWATSTWDSTGYESFLSNLTVGQQWAFQFAGNPTKSVRVAGRRGVVTPINGVDQQTEWLVTKGAGNGFQIVEHDSIPDIAVIGRDDRRFLRGQSRQPGSKVTIRQVDFRGTLEVTDSDALRRALTHGLGRSKGYGCGLLTLQPRTSVER